MSARRCECLASGRCCLPSRASPLPHVFGGELAPTGLAVLGVFGVHFGVAFVDAFELFFGQRQFLRGVAQQHQAANDGAKGNHQD